MKKQFVTLLPGLALLAAMSTQAEPLPPEQLQLRVVFNVGADLTLANSSTFNPRYFDGYCYVNQVNAGLKGIARYASGSNVPDFAINNSATVEHRMVTPFRGALSKTYLFGSGGAGTATFSRYNYDGSNRVDVAVPGDQQTEGFDWVDEDTIIYASYKSGNRTLLFLADVVAEPFAVTPNTSLGPDGYVATSASTRIRNVRVGDVYKNYAYYGDAGQNDYPNFFALNLTTGEETLLGNAGQLSGSGSFGVWTVLERGGYLYVQTTDNGIQIYNMTSATTVGSLFAEYSRYDLDAITGYTGQHYGFDVTSDGATLMLGSSQGQVFELGAPILHITRTNTEAVLSWPNSVTAVVIQSSPTISPAAFTDLDPQPEVVVVEKANTVNVTIGSNNAFFRLRKSF